METTLQRPEAPEKAEPFQGGPAFPFVTQDNYTAYGMSLRDYFAAAALQGLLASHGLSIDPTFVDRFGKIAYANADAMLRARG